MADWRLAKSLEVLIAEFDRLAPNRNKASDGTIGDAAHQQRPSDHNPNAQGVVCAADITHDPANGVDMDKMSDLLVERKHPALKYVIFNALIAGTHTNWQWQPNSGHEHHMHVSVGVGEDGQSTGPHDDTTPWGVADGATPPPSGGGHRFRTWGSGVNVRAQANTSSAVVNTLGGPTDIDVDFQVHGETVTAEGHTNDAWAHVPALGGFISNIYVDVPEAWLPGVPEGN